MSSKYLLVVGLLGLIVLPRVATADTAYFLGKKAGAPAQAGSSAVMSPSDFSNQVKTLQDKNNAQIQDQINANLAKTPPVQPPAILSQPLPPITTSPPAANTASTSNEAANLSMDNNAPLPQNNVTAAPTPHHARQRAQAAPTSSADAGGSAGQQTPYTGFSTTPGAAPAAPATGQAQPAAPGGWGIQY